MTRFCIMFCVLGLVVLLGGCDSGRDAPATPMLTYESSADGLYVSLSVSSDEITTSEMLRVKLLVRCDESMKVVLPELVEKWGDFFVFESHSKPAQLGSDGLVVHEVDYTLEPDVAGESSLTALAVTATNGNGEVVEVSSLPVLVKVSSVLKSGDTEMRDIASNVPEESAEGFSVWSIALLITSIVIVCCVIMVWLKHRKNQIIVDDGIEDDFIILKSASAAELMACIERVVCRVLAKQRQLTLPKQDFAGLHAVLEAEQSNITGFEEAVDVYEKLQYASQAVEENQVRALYLQFATIIDQQTKERIP